MTDTKNNTGDWNTGDKNTGDRNTGDRNTGDYNTGNRNTGYSNTGYYNTGNRNTGYSNTGDWNTGDRNTGDCNTGDWNTGDFNTNSPKVRLFNIDSGLEFDDPLISDIRSIIYSKVKNVCTWVYENDMSEEEKEEFETYKTTGGYLKVRDYQYCWKRGWEKMTEEERDKIKSLPNFCSKIFYEITGVNVQQSKNKVTLELTDEQFEEVKRIINQY